MNPIIRRSLKIIVFIIFFEIIFRCGGGIIVIIQGATNEVRSYIEEIQHHRPSEDIHAVRIVCVGDSMTIWGSYPEKLEMILNKFQKDRRYVVFKTGTPRLTLDQARSLIPETVNKYQPDIVILMIGIGDQLNISEKEQSLPSPSIKVLCNLLLKIKKNAEKMLGLKHGRVSTDLFIKNSSVQPLIDDTYQYIQDFLAGRQVKLVAVQYPLMDIDLLKNKFVSKNETIFVDNRKVFADAGLEDNYFAFFYDRLTQDMGHLTARGEEVLSKNIAEAILDQNFVK